MPSNQVAIRQNYDFGAPAAIAPVLKFRVKKGGRIDINIDADLSENNLVVTAQVSADDSTYNTVTANSNFNAINAVSIQRKTRKTYTLVLREGVDAYLQFLASGPGRGIIQIHGNDVLEIMSI